MVSYKALNTIYKKNTTTITTIKKGKLIYIGSLSRKEHIYSIKKVLCHILHLILSYLLKTVNYSGDIY